MAIPVAQERDTKLERFLTKNQHTQILVKSLQDCSFASEMGFQPFVNNEW